MKSSTWCYKLLTVLLLICTGLPPAAFGALEELVVTAQRREQNLQEVPIAVSAFTAGSMEKRGLTNIQQIGDFTPNVEMDSTSPFAGSSNVLSPFIRGIGQNDFAFNLEPGVGVYVDGVYYARTIGAVVDLLDLDRVEVLKGPQGTLFGRNTIGGAINIITRRPSEVFTWQGEVTTGSFNRLDVRGSADIPIIDDKLYSQVAFSSKNRDGYQHRIPYPGMFATSVTAPQLYRALDRAGDQEQGGENQWNLRGKLLWVVNNDVEVTVTGDYSHVDQPAVPTSLLDAAPEIPGAAAGVYNTCINSDAATLNFLTDNPAITGIPLNFIGLCTKPIAGTGVRLADPVNGGVNVDGDPSNDRLTFDDRYVLADKDTTYGAASNFSVMDSWGVTATIDWNISAAMKLKSITAYRGLLALFGVDNAPAGFLVSDPSFDTKQNQFSQELQLSGVSFNDRLNWLLGFYYFFEDGDLTDYVPFVEGLIQVYGQNFFDNESYAFFTHLNYALTDKLSFTAGMRYTDEKKKFDGRQKELNEFAYTFLELPLAALPDPTDLTRLYPVGVQHKSFSDVTLKFGAEYHFTDDLFAYFSYSEGFKSGGWTTRLLVPESPDPNLAPDFDEETATAYEVGIKSEWLERQLMVNLAGFFTKYDNIQVTVQKGISPTFDNAGKGEIAGFEGEFVGLVSDRFTLTGSLGYMDAKYTKLELFVDPELSIDDKFVNTPEWSASLSGEYKVPLQSGSNISFRMDYSYKSKMANDAVNTPLLMQDAVNLVNASATFTSPGGDWSLTAGGRNITDERYIYGGFRQPGIGYVSGNYSEPAEWYLTLHYSH